MHVVYKKDRTCDICSCLYTTYLGETLINFTLSEPSPTSIHPVEASGVVHIPSSVSVVFNHPPTSPHPSWSFIRRMLVLLYQLPPSFKLTNFPSSHETQYCFGSIRQHFGASQWEIRSASDCLSSVPIYHILYSCCIHRSLLSYHSLPGTT